MEQPYGIDKRWEIEVGIIGLLMKSEKNFNKIEKASNTMGSGLEVGWGGGNVTMSRTLEERERKWIIMLPFLLSIEWSHNNGIASGSRVPFLLVDLFRFFLRGRNKLGKWEIRIARRIVGC